MFITVKEPGKDISIHPGVIDGRRQYPLSKKCTKPRRRGRVYTKAITNLDRRQRAHEATLKSVDPKYREAFRKPGSMKARAS